MIPVFFLLFVCFSSIELSDEVASEYVNSFVDDVHLHIDDIFSAPKKVKKTEKKPSFEQLLDDNDEELWSPEDKKKIDKSEVCECPQYIHV